MEAAVRALLIQRQRWGMRSFMRWVPVPPAGALAKTLLDEPQLGLRPVAFLDNRLDGWEGMIEGIQLIGPLGLAPDFEGRAEAAIVSLPDISKDDATTLRRN